MRSGAMIAIVFVHNLLRRHPSCSILLHKALPAGTASSATSASQQNGNAEPHAAGSSHPADDIQGELSSCSYLAMPQQLHALGVPFLRFVCDIKCGHKTDTAFTLALCCCWVN